MFRLFCSHNALEFVPDFAVKNIHGMRKLRKSLGLEYKKVVKGSGCAKSNIISYEMYAILPQKKNYNKLAVFFGWRLCE